MKDEEGSDAHLRINARQVFADPPPYLKLMPWIDTLIEIAQTAPPTESATIGAPVDQLLAAEHQVILRMEEGLNKIRAGFPAGDRAPLVLDRIAPSFPVPWFVDDHVFPWSPDRAQVHEPLRRAEGSARSSVEVELHLCSVYRQLLGVP